jgi:hypothetical protein
VRKAMPSDLIPQEIFIYAPERLEENEMALSKAKSDLIHYARK